MTWLVTVKINGDIQTVEIEADDVFQAVQRCGFAAKTVICCVLSDECETMEPQMAPAKASFNQWYANRGEAGQFPLTAENIIRWVEETR